ncbi:DUF4174 domain-containing protein [Pantoea sp.]|uniref:DUF4174 domain-containing protein n=1 Tax=Pantoea sp. TaxID=69393 RepID=UPI0031E1D4FB
MLRITLLIPALFLTIIHTAQADEPPLFQDLTPSTANLNQYQWNMRPLVIFAPSKTDANYISQMAMLRNNADQLADRDIVVLSDTTPAENGVLRSQLKPEGFAVVLVGKDGGIKLRETTPLSSEVLLSTIDQMPMRKAGQK